VAGHQHEHFAINLPPLLAEYFLKTQDVVSVDSLRDYWIGAALIMFEHVYPYKVWLVQLFRLLPKIRLPQLQSFLHLERATTRAWTRVRATSLSASNLVKSFCDPGCKILQEFSEASLNVSMHQIVLKVRLNLARIFNLFLEQIQEVLVGIDNLSLWGCDDQWLVEIVEHKLEDLMTFKFVDQHVRIILVNLSHFVDKVVEE